VDYTTSNKPKMQMNRATTNRVTTNRDTTTKKPYCRACHNAGKPIDEYTSHWTRSSPGLGGVITCPLILSSECGYCHQAGHWTKFCPLLAEKEAEGEAEGASVDSGMSKSKKVLNWKTSLGMKGGEAEAAGVEAEAAGVGAEAAGVGAEAAGENSTRVVLNWKKALGMGEAFPSLSQKSKNSTPNLGVGVGVGGVAAPALTSWVSVVSLLPPPPPTSTLKMSKEEFKRIFCNFKRYENWADAESDDDDDDGDLPVGSLAVYTSEDLHR